jgi:hypothetical protein
VIPSIGLLGVSMYSRRVLGRSARSYDVMSVSLITVVWMPYGGSISANS